MSEPSVKSCAKFSLLFTNIQCIAASLLEKLYFEVQTAVFLEPYQMFQ